MADEGTIASSRGQQTNAHLTEEQIGKRAPVCPTCKEPLVLREPHRRFMEDDRYQQCINGHVWEVRTVRTCRSCGSDDVTYQAPDEGRPYSCNHCGLEFFEDEGA